MKKPNTLRFNPKHTVTWKLLGPLVWIIAGVLFFINYNWIAGALAMLMLILCTKHQGS